VGVARRGKPSGVGGRTTDLPPPRWATLEVISRGGLESREEKEAGTGRANVPEAPASKLEGRESNQVIGGRKAEPAVPRSREFKGRKGGKKKELQRGDAFVLELELISRRRRLA